VADEKYTFEQAKIRLEEIATLARKKDTSLEKSLDLLEEGVRLANICTELVDHTDLSATATVEVPEGTEPTVISDVEGDSEDAEVEAEPEAETPQDAEEEAE
jgi:exodeoxyribonuclease VII small subunit